MKQVAHSECHYLSSLQLPGQLAAGGAKPASFCLFLRLRDKILYRGKTRIPQKCEDKKPVTGPKRAPETKTPAQGR
jgi:hypothetical protein